MSLKTKKVAELREIAEEFGVDLEGVKGKAAIIDALAEEGVDDAMLSNFEDAEHEDAPVKEEAAPAPKKIVGNEVVVKMERGNPTYEILGHVFTSAHPYVVMSEEDAQEIFDRERGFRIATPSETREYYS